MAAEDHNFKAGDHVWMGDWDRPHPKIWRDDKTILRGEVISHVHHDEDDPGRCWYLVRLERFRWFHIFRPKRQVPGVYLKKMDVLDRLAEI